MRGYIITYRMPPNPEHAAALRCRHKNDHAKVNTKAGHCSDMGCPNYSERCPLHAIARTGDTCSRTKKTGPCPFSSNCTDVTGEHHSLILWAHNMEEVTRMAQGYLVPGSHITRIEESE